MDFFFLAINDPNLFLPREYIIGLFYKKLISNANVFQKMNHYYLSKLTHQPDVMSVYETILSYAQLVPISSQSIKDYFKKDTQISINLPFGL